jgi:hypothetical protein
MIIFWIIFAIVAGAGLLMLGTAWLSGVLPERDK